LIGLKDHRKKHLWKEKDVAIRRRHLTEDEGLVKGGTQEKCAKSNRQSARKENCGITAGRFLTTGADSGKVQMVVFPALGRYYMGGGRIQDPPAIFYHSNLSLGRKKSMRKKARKRSEAENTCSGVETLYRGDATKILVNSTTKRRGGTEGCGLSNEGE